MSRWSLATSRTMNTPSPASTPGLRRPKPSIGKSRPGTARPPITSSRRPRRDRKNIHVHSIRADRTINIDFTGFDAGSASTGVTVSTDGDLVVKGVIRNDGGDTKLSAGGKINPNNDGAAVGGRNITLTAGSGIGVSMPIQTDLANGLGGRLNATTTYGNIQINELSGDLILEQVLTSKANGDVLLMADGNILAYSDTSLVRGGAITLTSRFGSVGSLGGGTAMVPGGSARALAHRFGRFFARYRHNQRGGYAVYPTKRHGICI